MQQSLSNGDKDQSIVAQVLGAITRDLPAPRAIVLGKPDPIYLMKMRDAVIAPAPGAFRQCVANLRQAGVSTVTLAEVYVPLIAQRLGDEWVADTLDFGAVSVGSSRLQSLLWQLGPDWAHTGVLVSSSRKPVLVAVARGCQHTLGATLLAGQLRYRGISVELNLEFVGAPAGVDVAEKSYAAIFLSASSRERLETLAGLVRKARRAFPATPILIGGNVTDQTADIQKQTGADLVTCDLEEALAFCQLGASFAVAAQVNRTGTSA